ncbi:MAG: penicillin-binding protein 1A [Bacteriovorax sp.]|nr:penicillin-binding protein 1A [Rhizobacter sp.]
MSEPERKAQQPENLAANMRSPKPSNWSRWVVRSAAWLTGLAAAGAASVTVLVGIALAVAYPNLPEINGLMDYRPKLPMRVLSADGVLLGEYGEERRNFTPLAQIPKVMQEAVLASEDARFYEHNGVDIRGVLRAGLAQFNRSRSQGASTITMQVARNFYLSTEKTYTRKIYEMLLAFKMESVLSKDQILEVYMNQIFLGQRAYGFASASEIYFGKPLRDITVAEAAMLAGLPQAPSLFNPITNPKRAKDGQLRILDRMFDNGFITAAQRDAARTESLHYREPSDVPVHAEYVAEAARQLIFAQYGEDAYTRGLNVHLTIKSDDQMVAYRALRKGIMDYERRQVYRGPEDYTDLPANGNDVDARVAEALQDHPDNDELKAAVATEVSAKKVVAVLQSGDAVTITGEGLKPVASGLVSNGNPKTQIRPGAVIRLIRNAKGDWSITQLPEVEGAFVALDPRTGAVRAMVGGFDFSKSKFNHVTQAWRQPGSSFKPFIYSAALEKGFTPATVINDAPLFFDAGATGSQPWEPKNYDGKFDGPMTMRRGLEKSKNMISIRILQSIGTSYAQNWITRFGFEAEKHPAYLPMALGTGSVTPLQMALAYSVFANGGFRVNPQLISKITDAKGRVLSEATPQVLNESMRTIDARNAFVMDSLLQSVALRGTAAPARRALNRPDLYGKTGTTNDSIDTWFAGFQPTVVGIVWVGYDTPRKLGDNETGGGLSLPIWVDYMRHALNGVPVQQYAVPEGVVNTNDEWFYDEYTRGTGVVSVGLDDKLPAAPNEDERKSILDLFRR